MITRREARRRAVFPFHDGARPRRVDPVGVYRRLTLSPGWSESFIEDIRARPDLVWEGSTADHLAAVRRAFSVPAVDAGGLTDREVIALEARLLAWFADRSSECRPLIDVGGAMGHDAGATYRADYAMFCGLWWSAELSRQASAIPTREAVEAVLGLTGGEPYPLGSFQAAFEDPERALFEYRKMAGQIRMSRALAESTVPTAGGAA